MICFFFVIIFQNYVGEILKLWIFLILLILKINDFLEFGKFIKLRTTFEFSSLNIWNGLNKGFLKKIFSVLVTFVNLKKILSNCNFRHGWRRTWLTHTSVLSSFNMTLPVSSLLHYAVEYLIDSYGPREAWSRDLLFREAREMHFTRPS